jgi:hypothetical protein
MFEIYVTIVALNMVYFLELIMNLPIFQNMKSKWRLGNKKYIIGCNNIKTPRKKTGEHAHDFSPTYWRGKI